MNEERKEKSAVQQLILCLASLLCIEHIIIDLPLSPDLASIQLL